MGPSRTSTEHRPLLGERQETPGRLYTAFTLSTSVSSSGYPPGVPRSGWRPLLQYPVEVIEGTLSNPRAVGLALRFSGRVIAYAAGSPLEDNEEEGVLDDPHYGERQTFYLLATATHPSVENDGQIMNLLLELLAARARESGYVYLSTVIEERWREAGPAWWRSAHVLRVLENYLGSGIRFAYLQTALSG